MSSDDESGMGCLGYILILIGINIALVLFGVPFIVY